jgi:hypothetical protein
MSGVVDPTSAIATVSQSVNRANGFWVHGGFCLSDSTGNIFDSLKLWKILTKRKALVLKAGGC